VPRNVQTLILALGPVTDALSAELQRSPAIAELATCMLVRPEEIIDARHAADSQSHRSLDEPAHPDGGDALAETLGLRGHLTQREIAERIEILQMAESRLLRWSLERLHVIAGRR
jgi:DNA-directed RNA polymerase specialized sigma subunit